MCRRLQVGFVVLYMLCLNLRVGLLIKGYTFSRRGDVLNEYATAGDLSRWSVNLNERNVNYFLSEKFSLCQTTVLYLRERIHEIGMNPCSS